MRLLVRIAAVSLVLMSVVALQRADASTANALIKDFVFEPPNLTIVVGDRVTWTNVGSVMHTSTSDAGLWDSGPIGPNGGTFTGPVLNTLGTYLYHCNFHSFMTGTITVVTRQTPAPSPSPTTPPPPPTTTPPTTTAPGTASPTVPPTPSASPTPSPTLTTTAAPTRITATPPPSASAAPLGGPASQANTVIGYALIGSGLAIIAGALWWRFGRA